MGADVIKVERPGSGDITRGQLRDVKGADSLYFTMLNGSKRSITIDSKHPKGKEILDRLVKECDVLVENFAPGALDRMGKTTPRPLLLCDRLQQLAERLGRQIGWNPQTAFESNFRHVFLFRRRRGFALERFARSSRRTVTGSIGAGR